MSITSSTNLRSISSSFLTIKSLTMYAHRCKKITHNDTCLSLCLDVRNICGHCKGLKGRDDDTKTNLSTRHEHNKKCEKIWSLPIKKYTRQATIIKKETVISNLIDLGYLPRRYKDTNDKKMEVSSSKLYCK